MASNQSQALNSNSQLCYPYIVHGVSIYIIGGVGTNIDVEEPRRQESHRVMLHDVERGKGGGRITSHVT